MLVRRMFVVGLVLGIVGIGVVSLAGSASADANVGVNPENAFSCHLTLTVVPGDIYYDGKYGWQENGDVTGQNVCHSGGQTTSTPYAGSWQRDGWRNSATGQCPSARLFLSVVGSPGSWQTWYEMTQEGAGVDSTLWGIDPIYMPPGGVPFGNGAIFEPVPSGGTFVARVDPAACAHWPTQDQPTDYTVPVPAQAPFHITADGGTPSLLSLCLTVQGVVPRSCIAA
jgi:hypothetical protein